MGKFNKRLSNPLRPILKQPCLGEESEVDEQLLQQIKSKKVQFIIDDQILSPKASYIEDERLEEEEEDNERVLEDRKHNKELE